MNGFEISTEHVHTYKTGIFEISCEDAGCAGTMPAIVATAQCIECRAYTDVVYLVSNHAGGAANACELIVCSADVDEVLARAAYALDRPIERLKHNGQLVDAQVFVDNEHYVKACQVSVASALCA